MHGRGVFVWATGRFAGDRYDGDWDAGNMNGHGVYFFANGDRYDGDWFNGAMQGRGVYHLTSGNRYEGEFVEDQKTGRGSFVYASGDKYEGDWLTDEKHGSGVRHPEERCNYLPAWAPHGAAGAPAI